jgi:predicted MFS family arabinose efflux permease
MRSVASQAGICVIDEAKDQASLAEHSQRRREQLVLLILAAVQFTTIVDFMVVMPLGPQLMRKLNIGTAEFGLIVSSYTFAAGAAGLVASAIVDRFARRTAFMTLYAGFLLGTLLCGLAPNYQTLVAARVLTGAFGGILGGMAMTIVGDVFPEERRGRATGFLMSGFALASVVGVPFGLFLGTEYGWHVPFFVLVIGGLPGLALIPFALPRLDAHVGKAHAHPLRSLVETFRLPNHLNAFALTIALVMGGFTVFPYVSAFLVGNVGMTEQQLPLLYIVGGCLTLVASPIIGRIADRYGKLLTFRCCAPLSALLLLAVTNLPRVHASIAIAVFGALMVSNVGRMIAAMAMITGSVEQHRRGGFLSANASVQHIASGIGATVAGLILTQTPAGRVENFGAVGWIAAGSTLLSLWLAGRVRVLDQPVSAAAVSLAAAAEASVDAGEPIADIVEEV